MHGIDLGALSTEFLFSAYTHCRIMWENQPSSQRSMSWQLDSLPKSSTGQRRLRGACPPAQRLDSQHIGPSMTWGLGSAQKAWGHSWEWCYSDEVEKPRAGATELWANKALNPLLMDWKLRWWILDSVQFIIFYRQHKRPPRGLPHASWSFCTVKN